MSDAPTLAKTPSNEKHVSMGVIFIGFRGLCGTRTAHGRNEEARGFNYGSSTHVAQAVNSAVMWWSDTG